MMLGNKTSVFILDKQEDKISWSYFWRNWLIFTAYPDKKPGCRFAPFAFPMKTGMSLRSICNFAYLLIKPKAGLFSRPLSSIKLVLTCAVSCLFLSAIPSWDK